jgi:hypothetical protein
MALMTDGNGKLSLMGRALLFWIKLSPEDRKKSLIGAPLAAMKYALEHAESGKLHPSLEPLRADLIRICKEELAKVKIKRPPLDG